MRGATDGRAWRTLEWVITGAILVAAMLLVAWALRPGPLDAGPGIERGAHMLAAGVVADSLAVPVLLSVRDAAVSVVAACGAVLAAFLTATIRRRLGLSTRAKETGRLQELAEHAVVGAEQQGATLVPVSGASKGALKRGLAVEGLLGAAEREGLKLDTGQAAHLVEGALGRLKKVL